jgi:hypothetical protein
MTMESAIRPHRVTLRPKPQQCCHATLAWTPVRYMSASHCAVVFREYRVVACRLQHALDLPDEDMRCRCYFSFYYHQKRPCIAKAATDSTAKLPPPPQGVELRRRRANPSVSCVFFNRRGRSRGLHRGEPCVKSMPCCVCNGGRDAASGRSPRVLASVDPRSLRMCVGHRPPVCRGPCPSPAMREP